MVEASTKDGIVTLKLTAILAALTAQPLIPSRAKAPKNGTKLGDVSEELQRLWSLKTAKAREAERLKLDHQHADDDAARQQIADDYYRVRTECTLIQELFWFEIRTEFSAWGESRLVVTNQWEIWSEPEQCQCIACQLGRVFGDEAEPHGEAPAEPDAAASRN